MSKEAAIRWQRRWESCSHVSDQRCRTGDIKSRHPSLWTTRCVAIPRPLLTSALLEMNTSGIPDVKEESRLPPPPPPPLCNLCYLSKKKKKLFSWIYVRRQVANMPCRRPHGIGLLLVRIIAVSYFSHEKLFLRALYSLIMAFHLQNKLTLFWNLSTAE